MKIAKQIIGFLLALSLPLVLIACGDGMDTPKSGGSKRQYDDSIPAELEGDKYNLHNYSLETADGIYYDANGERMGDAADGVAHTKNYRNDVTVSCKLASGYTVTLGMGDKEAGSNAVYLNPTCSNPNGAVFYIEAERMMFPQYSTPMELATVKLADFPAMDTNSIAAFQWYEDTMGVDANYYNEYDYGVAWQDSILVDGDSGSETLTIKVCDKVTGEELGTIVAHIDYDAENDIYFLADLNEVLDSAA